MSRLYKLQKYQKKVLRDIYIYKYAQTIDKRLTVPAHQEKRTARIM